ncbi:ring-1,2-phenylacetyl-CoA epoxidase subunit PaaC [Allocatelliglobosispora scoriae]|uniref:Ring-1,2-phenylacetyl-CoA epoxidase subunit PaaC n=1 Tax=Allocatelliglobosispora scoriae TaxID=643052 RepID=A0A841BUB6_9ACTN|nr:1,2-phenylacetyl-CoA epoxidase subunit PaaC [Allocatelliglobosispora scoriae]MBB5870749.1 ring-1,2-phenylacetyl-CoA epoxidase subunit PaaC [Allocatelliglobosispora scoriae]
MTGTELALQLGDDALIAAQRLAEWSARAPSMEEDVALANIALDQLGAARLFLAEVGDEDELAFLRADHEFRNCLLVELPNGPYRGDLDFGWTIAKLLFLSSAQLLRYRTIAAEGGPLAPIAAKVAKESAYHVDHASRWTIRLGDGTPESHDRMAAAVEGLWAYSSEVCDDRAAWLALIEPVLAEATLPRPADGPVRDGGRAGRHTEHLSYLLGEMQVLHRAHPGAQW